MSANRDRLLVLLAAPLAACVSPPAVPENPTWAQVEPILRGNCTHCHGATAERYAHAGDTVYRFDFFEMSEEICGRAAFAIDTRKMAHDFAPLIAEVITPPAPGGRARMPPSPGPALSDWERETLLRWAESPMLGPPLENGRPNITITSDLAPTVGDVLDFTVLVDDPDGESVVGVLTIGDATLKLDGPRSFHITVSTSDWANGTYSVAADLCDGWDPVSYALPDIVVAH